MNHRVRRSTIRSKKYLEEIGRDGETLPTPENIRSSFSRFECFCCQYRHDEADGTIDPMYSTISEWCHGYSKTRDYRKLEEVEECPRKNLHSRKS